MDDLITQKHREFENNGFLHFSTEELKRLSEKEISALKDRFQGFALMKLPEQEISFFEWLKTADRPVWDDLWAGDETEYMVSIDLLEHFTSSGNGFPICDLVTEDNYWFSVRMIKPKGRELFPGIEEKLNKDAKLDFAELLLVEVMQGSIDIWHFCHRDGISIQYAKKKIAEMQREDLLVHLEDREDLVKYIDF